MNDWRGLHGGDPARDPVFRQADGRLVHVHAVTCPRCRALPGELCRDRRGRVTRRSHPARYRALVG